MRIWFTVQTLQLSGLENFCTFGYRTAFTVRARESRLKSEDKLVWFSPVFLKPNVVSLWEAKIMFNRTERKLRLRWDYFSCCQERKESKTNSATEMLSLRVESGQLHMRLSFHTLFV